MYLVTGASSGIGRATASELVQRGETVLAVARNIGVLDTLKFSYPDTLHTLSADVSSDSGIDDIVQSVSTRILKGIVHAAGTRVPLTDYSALESSELVNDFAVHVAAPIALNNQLKLNCKGGRIVYIDSYSAKDPRVGWAGYSIVKAAAQMAARCAAEETHDSRIVRIFPGGVRTALVEGVLNSDNDCSTAEIFKALDKDGELTEPEIIGCYIADLLLKASNEQLDAREYWDISRSSDQIF